jgi:hypothetical protein
MIEIKKIFEKVLEEKRVGEKEEGKKVKNIFEKVIEEKKEEKWITIGGQHVLVGSPKWKDLTSKSEKKEGGENKEKLKKALTDPKEGEKKESGGGQAAGEMEVIKLKSKEARDWAEKECKKYDRDLNKEFPDFDKNFKFAQDAAGLGHTTRKDMPVIEEKDVKNLQRRLEEGYIDIKEPFAPETKDRKDPFPTGISGDMAKKWLTAGLRDGSKPDDMIKVKSSNDKVKTLKPIQKQIYFDKAMSATIKNGRENTIKFLKSTTMITSSDKHIIDGHHRWFSGLICDPDMTMNTLEIDLPIKELLPLSKSFGSAAGNKANE